MLILLLSCLTNIWFLLILLEIACCPTHLQDYSNEDIPPHTYTSIYNNNIKKLVNLDHVMGENSTKNINLFMCIYDSCKQFICEIPKEEVSRLSNIVSNLCQEPLKSSVWKPRAEHHVYLLIDGLVKLRCLFKDFDDTFTPKQEDYDLAERILVRMAKSWKTDVEKSFFL